MSEHVNFIGADIGASNGRLLMARFDGSRFDLEVLHRFPNQFITAAGRSQWDILRIWNELLTGLTLYSGARGAVGRRRIRGTRGWADSAHRHPRRSAPMKKLFTLVATAAMSATALIGSGEPAVLCGSPEAESSSTNSRSSGGPRTVPSIPNRGIRAVQRYT